ncbi:MAG: hypothetical protein NT027_17125, partial [Proteobacteria bacterium]|nr:hypothetical protein [Pseudomonadota bacterium]
MKSGNGRELLLPMLNVCSSKSISSSLSVLIIVSISSCGQLFQKDSSDINPTRYSSIDDVMLSTVEDESCDQGSGSSKIDEATVWIWNGSEAKPTNVTLTNSVNSNGGLVTPGTSYSLYNYRAESSCSENDGSIECGKSTELQGEKIVKFCRSNASYGRESIESVALTSKYIVAKSRSFYESLTNAKPSLAGSILVVQPQFIKNYSKKNGEKKQLVDSDNAGFASDASVSKEGLFAVFPTSKKDFETTGLHLWEVPFVMSHEYGHNVFHHHLGALTKKVGITLQSSRSLDHMISDNDKSIEDDGVEYRFLADKKGADLALGGINEMFADFFAFFSNEEKSGLLKRVNCLDQTRDPTSSLTALGKLKVWDLNAHDIFEGRKSAAKRQSCYDPSFAGEHDVAAVIGYPMVKWIQGLTPNK